MFYLEEAYTGVFVSFRDKKMSVCNLSGGFERDPPSHIL